MAPQRGRYAGGVRCTARELGGGRAVASMVKECLIAEGLERPIAPGLRPHRFRLDALRRGKRRGRRSRPDTPLRGPARRICWQAKQVKGGDGGRLVNSLVPTDVA